MNTNIGFYIPLAKHEFHTHANWELNKKCFTVFLRESTVFSFCFLEPSSFSWLREEEFKLFIRCCLVGCWSVVVVCASINVQKKNRICVWDRLSLLIFFVCLFVVFFCSCVSCTSFLFIFCSALVVYIKSKFWMAFHSDQEHTQKKIYLSEY